MSKSGAPSASASASVSASSPSSHDPHSLPPNVKGLVQRYLAVSLPTITLTPELIDILDRSEVLIPNRIQVTMRWWKEDAPCSLSVYPKLNSPLPKAIEKRQALLQQRQQLEKQQQQVEHQLQQQQLQRDRQRDSPSLLHRRSHNTLNSIAMPGPTQPQSSAQGQTQAQSRTAASFLKRPWSGARLLNVFRKGKQKSKERLAATASAADVREIHNLTPTPTPSRRGESPAPLNAMSGHVTETETKPLPSLPDAAFPITVAYPTRCTLEQLRQYFGEMTPLTLEIQITPRLSAMTTVPNLVDLFLNIHGTFSGVFSFSTIVRNDDPRLPSELMFKNRVLLGMVVFQAWLQDTSNVDDSDEDSESISTGSMFAMLDDAPGTTPHHMHPAYHQHHRHSSHHHGPHNPPHSRPLPPPIHTVQPAQPHLPHHPPPTQHVPPPLPASSQYTHPMQRPHPPSLGPPQAPMQPREYDRTPHRIPQHPLSNQYPNPQVHLQQRPPPQPQQHQQLPHQPRQQQVIPPTQTQRPPSHQVHPVYPGQPGHPMHPRHPAHQGHQGHPGFPGQAYPADRDGFGHRVAMRYDEDPYPGSQHKLPSRPQASGAPGPRYPQDVPPVRDDMHPHPREHLSHSGRYQTLQTAEASGSGAGKASSRYSHGRIQAPDIGPSGGVYPTAPHPQSHHPHHHPHQPQPQHQNRQYHQQQQQQDRRDRPPMEESHDEQGSRSRPRASATAAVIGRLENVQARGHELLNAMRTSFALDPEEVRNRSARDIRSSALYHEDVEDERYTPYHENLPYWPSRSRFSLELSIPTAYLTTEGLLRGSIQKKHSSMPLTSSSGRSSESPSHGDWGRDSPHHRPSSQQQQQQQRQSRHHAEYQQPRQPGSSQHQAQDPQRRDHSTPVAAAPTTAAATTATTAVAPNTTTATATTPNTNTNTNLAGSGATGVVGSGSGTVPTPRPLRRSGKPIQFEKLASRTGDLDRLRQAQEESLRPQYQSFQSGTPEFGVSEPPASDPPKERFRPLDQYGQQRPHARGQQQPRMTDRDWDRDNSPQPRKSRSYPPPPPSKGRVHRRRLSSNDRLQLRMNPRAGDVLNYLPDLFPSKSMSALLVPEYISSSSGSSSVGSHTGSSISTEDDERSQVYGYGGSGGVDLGGRQSRLQKRPHKSYRHYHSETKRHQSQRHQQYHHQQHGMSGPSSRSRRRETRGSRVHPQHFNFKVNCQLQLTPEVMAACMVENISIEVWKLNSKRQTMIELGSAKLPLHKVFSRIMQKTATMSTSPLPAPPSAGSRYHSQNRDRMGPRSGYMRPSRESNAVFKEGWRLEPSVFDIRSRQGTIIGQLDAHLWIHPRSRSDSMVSAAA